MKIEVEKETYIDILERLLELEIETEQVGHKERIEWIKEKLEELGVKKD